MEKHPYVIALTGNPNAGKSAIFNGLIGIQYQTGNKPEKQVSLTHGEFSMGNMTYQLVDLPSTYSLCTQSKKGQITKDFICSGKAQMAIVVCDATSLEYGLDLLKCIIDLELVKDNGIPVILCINHCDRINKKNIEIDFELLQDVLQLPVTSCCAHCPKDLSTLKTVVHEISGHTLNYSCLDFSPKHLTEEITHCDNYPLSSLSDAVRYLRSILFNRTHFTIK